MSNLYQSLALIIYLPPVDASQNNIEEVYSTLISQALNAVTPNGTLDIAIVNGPIQFRPLSILVATLYALGYEQQHKELQQTNNPNENNKGENIPKKIFLEKSLNYNIEVNVFLNDVNGFDIASSAESRGWECMAVGKGEYSQILSELLYEQEYANRITPALPILIFSMGQYPVGWLYNSSSFNLYDSFSSDNPNSINSQHSNNSKNFPITPSSCLSSKSSSVSSFPISFASSKNLEIDFNDHLLPDQQGLYPVVAIGGTFDHLHAGHKILLTMAGFLASKKLIIGVTGESLLTNKKYKEYLDPIDKRCKAVSSFLKAVFPTLSLDVVVIEDIYGPTASDPDIQAIVVSGETHAGAIQINKLREAKNMNSLKIWQIPVIGGSAHDGFKGKLSSTLLRERDAYLHQKIL